LLAATNVLAGGSFDWIISAGVISRAFATGAVVVQKRIPPPDQPRKGMRKIDRQSGQRESNPHGQLGRLELYH
jgi:hypothetical protein